VGAPIRPSSRREGSKRSGLESVILLENDNSSFLKRRQIPVLLIHPIMHFLVFILACYVFYLGMKRFFSLHLKQNIPFPWRRHVLLGIVALATFLAGMPGGIYMVYAYWRSYLITGLHAKIAISLLPFMAFGMLSGLYMNADKKKRKWLPIFHAANNAIVLLLVMAQVITGWKILTKYVLGQ
jgi:hypothetical protein